MFLSLYYYKVKLDFGQQLPLRSLSKSISEIFFLLHVHWKYSTDFCLFLSSLIKYQKQDPQTQTSYKEFALRDGKDSVHLPPSFHDVDFTLMYFFESNWYKQVVYWKHRHSDWHGKRSKNNYFTDSQEQQLRKSISFFLYRQWNITQHVCSHWWSMLFWTGRGSGQHTDHSDITDFLLTRLSLWCNSPLLHVSSSHPPWRFNVILPSLI